MNRRDFLKVGAAAAALGAAGGWVLHELKRARRRGNVVVRMPFQYTPEGKRALERWRAAQWLYSTDNLTRIES